MLQEGFSESLKSIINIMYNTPDQTINFKDQSRNIQVQIHISPGAMMSLEYFQQVKDKTVSFKIPDFPIYVYHNSIARLTPIYNQLCFLEKHADYANSDLILSFAATVSNVSLMLGEQSLIKTENHITELLPSNLQTEMIIICGPIADDFVLTIHFVKMIRDGVQRANGATLWKPFTPDSVFSHLGKEFSVIDSFLLKQKFKPQGMVFSQLRALQMNLSAISVNISIDDNDEESESS